MPINGNSIPKITMIARKMLHKLAKVCKMSSSKEEGPMGIHWFDARERQGQASLTESYITLNSIAAVPFEYAYKVQVGVSEEGNVVISPLSKERVMRGDLDEYTLQNISLKQSYSRICSRELMRQIEGETGLKLGKSAQSFETSWDEGKNLLTIKVGGAE